MNENFENSPFYILKKLECIYKNIPECPAKDYIDYILSKSSYLSYYQHEEYLEDNKLHVHRQEIKHKDYVTGKFTHEIVEYTKTEAGDRYIYLSPSAQETIKHIRKLNPGNEFMMQVGGRKIYTNTFNDRLYKACDACDLPRRSMHKIRKTYGTLLLDSDIEDSLVMEQMGHSDIATTRRY